MGRINRFLDWAVAAGWSHRIVFLLSWPSGFAIGWAVCSLTHGGN